MPLLRFAFGSIAAWLVSCSSGLPVPPRGSHPREAALVVVVDYPPPAAQVEFVPERPKDERCVWLDGHWEWVDRRWRWTSGGWVVPPPSCYFAPPTTYWIGTELIYLRPHWYPVDAEDLPPEKARSACPPPVSCGRPA
jgi:hypothetical protein